MTTRFSPPVLSLFISTSLFPLPHLTAARLRSQQRGRNSPTGYLAVISELRKCNMFALPHSVASTSPTRCIGTGGGVRSIADDMTFLMSTIALPAICTAAIAAPSSREQEIANVHKQAVQQLNKLPSQSLTVEAKQSCLISVFVSSVSRTHHFAPPIKVLCVHFLLVSARYLLPCSMSSSTAMMLSQHTTMLRFPTRLMVL